MSRFQPLRELGQAVWLDYIRRDILDNGHLKTLVTEDGVSGLTSNPAIFKKAIAESDLYDRSIRELLDHDPTLSTERLYERLAIEDIRKAADILRPTFDDTAGADGYVSLEVSPHLARDGEGSVREAKRLWQEVDRPNLLIKIPATREGIPAIRRLLSDGISVNVTLMFSLAHYEAVAQAFLAGLQNCPDPHRLASVASFFVSRVDSNVDARLEDSGDPEAMKLRGKVAVANSKVTYQRYLELFSGEAFRQWRDRGVRPQRVLWASTSTKNPDYRDVLYVEELIGNETVNTLPPQTVEAFRAHGEARLSLTERLEEARSVLESLPTYGIDLDEVTESLQREGVEQFIKPYDDLLAALDAKRHALSEPGAG